MGLAVIRALFCKERNYKHLTSSLAIHIIPVQIIKGI